MLDYEQMDLTSAKVERVRKCLNQLAWFYHQYSHELEVLSTYSLGIPIDLLSSNLLRISQIEYIHITILHIPLQYSWRVSAFNCLRNEQRVLWNFDASKKTAQAKIFSQKFLRNSWHMASIQSNV